MKGTIGYREEYSYIPVVKVQTMRYRKAALYKNQYTNRLSIRLPLWLGVFLLEQKDSHRAKVQKNRVGA